MALSARPVTAEATMTVLVVRDTGGDLVDGARTRVARLPEVASVDGIDVHGVQPALNDLRVEATVRVTLRNPPDDAADLETRLAGGFGIRDARVRRLDDVES